MGTKAVGAYLRTLREAHGLTQVDVAESVGVSVKQIGRWESGESDPSASGLAAFTKLVEGSAEYVQILILDDTATEEDGRRLAEAWLRHLQGEQDREGAVVTAEPLPLFPKDRMVSKIDQQPILERFIIEIKLLRTEIEDLKAQFEKFNHQLHMRRNLSQRRWPITLAIIQQLLESEDLILEDPIEELFQRLLSQDEEAEHGRK